MIGQVLRALEENGLAENTLVRLHHRPRRAGRGARPVVEADDVRGLRPRPGHRLLARRPAGGPALPARRQRPRPDGHHPGRGAGAGPARDGREEPAGPARRPRRPRAGAHRRRPATPAIPRPSPAAWEDVAFSEFCVEEGWYQRLVRSGPWKLTHYHGHRPQLFNLEEDPLEDARPGRGAGPGPPAGGAHRPRPGRLGRGGHRPGHRRPAGRRGRCCGTGPGPPTPATSYRWALTPEMNFLEPVPAPAPAPAPPTGSE